MRLILLGMIGMLSCYTFLWDIHFSYIESLIIEYDES